MKTFKILGICLLLISTGCDYQKNQHRVVEEVKAVTSAKEDFVTFIYTFCNDQKFQLSRVKFPLLYSYKLDLSNDTIYSESIPSKNWEHTMLFFTEKYTINTYDNFGKKVNDTDERVISYEGVENDIEENYFFKRIQGKWFLVKKESYSQ